MINCDCKKEILKFDKLHSGNISEIRRILSRKNPDRTCEYTFGSVYIWGDYFDGEYGVFRDTVFGKSKNPAFTSDAAVCAESFSLPAGELPLDAAVSVLSEYAAEKGEKSLILKSVPEAPAKYLGEKFGAKVDELVDFGDYLYSAESLATLKGHKYNKKRNRVNQFRRNYPDFSFEKATPENLERIFELFYKVKNQKDESFDIIRAVKTRIGESEPPQDGADQAVEIQGIAESDGIARAVKTHIGEGEPPQDGADQAVEIQRVAYRDERLRAASEYEARQIEKLLKNLETTGLLYYALFVGGRAVAFTVGEVVGDTLYTHIEKADKDYEGAYQTVNQLFADEICKNFPLRYINREDDLGDAGLRQAKMSYYPVEILKKYRVEIEIA